MVACTSGMVAAPAAPTVPLRITLIQAVVEMAGVGELVAEVIDHGLG